MCLQIDVKSESRAEKLRKKSGYKVYWKIVCNRAFLLTSKVQSYYRWNAGWNHSNRISAIPYNDEKRFGEISLGIHVYTSRAIARKNAWLLNGSLRIIKVRCYNKDCVAYDFDGTEAVYTKVFLTRKEHQHAINRTARERK